MAHIRSILTTSYLLAAHIACLLAPLATAQRLPDTTNADIAAEALLENLDDALGDPAQLAELLAVLRAHPLDLNTASAEDLAQIPAFSPALARNIIR